MQVRGGTARFTPRGTLVAAGGTRTVLARRIHLPGGRRVPSRRPASVRVATGARTLRATFTVRGVRRVRTIALTRR